MSSVNSIYIPYGEDGYELCHPVRQEDFFYIKTALNGLPAADGWHSVRVELIRMDKGRSLNRSDAPYLGLGGLVLRKNLPDNIMSLFYKYGEILPLSGAEGDLIIFNPTLTLDALDEERSSIVKIGNGVIGMVTNYVLKSDILLGADIFKIPSWRYSPIYVSEDFVNAWEGAGLHGLRFKKVWSG